ncbi:AAA-ATPase [Cardamine amara subsp. amara]|uniref:AAA-ATPase n=1 Tax=Cardamine amara subsp. amara TaxID=228776 RepID=A0ABD1ABZ7_CARAN
MMMLRDSFGSIGSSMASLFFIWATIQQIFPDHLKITIKEFLLSSFQQLCFAQRVSDHFTNLFSPYVEINFPESDEYRFSHAFLAIETYLDSKSTERSKRLRGSQVKESKGLVLKRNEAKVRDEYEGANVWWECEVDTDGSRYDKLTFHNRARSFITDSYNMWRYIEFEHPASFETLAMDPEKKEEIVNDLIAFTNGKEYYKKIGKAWKRSYLLYGPPGTGKSTMISAMANLLNYNIYDLELTAIKNNSELKKLLTATSSKSIIVIEDIDCSAEFTSNRIKKESNLRGKNGEEACGQERIVVFTTNHLEKLDPALIRRGRMDMHIELSYCTYEAFKILAKNYLDLDDDDDDNDNHPLFREIKSLLEETMTSPADVAKKLMARNHQIDADESLTLLINALEKESYHQRTQHDKKKNKKFKIFG